MRKEGRRQLFLNLFMNHDLNLYPLSFAWLCRFSAEVTERSEVKVDVFLLGRKEMKFISFFMNHDLNSNLVSFACLCGFVAEVSERSEVKVDSTFLCGVGARVTWTGDDK